MHTTVINPEELGELLDTPNICVIDVRHELAQVDAGWRAYQQSRIPGATFLDTEHELSGARTSSNGHHPLPQREVFHALMVQAGVGVDSQVVVYGGEGCAMAARLWWMLRWLGFSNVAVLDGGWLAWQQAGLPIDTALISERILSGPAARPLELQDALTTSVTMADVLRNLEAQELLLVDARAQARYRGQTEPFAPIAGHIPGAVNRPNKLNLDRNGRFKQPERLVDEFMALLNRASPDMGIHQCGSGIDACHNVIAMEHAGLTGSRLYPGSWSEWCSDPIRPVA